MKKRLGWKIARISSAVLLLYGGASYWLACAYLSPHRIIPATPFGLKDGKIGDVPIWQTPKIAAGEPSPVVFVFAHGYGGNRASFDGVMQDLSRLGYDSVALAMPGQDASPDPSVGFGPKEADTIAAAAHWCKERGAKKVIACGISLGGSAAWLATQKSHDIDGVVSESAFARFDEAMDHWFQMLGPGGRVVLRPMVWIAIAKSGIDPAKIAPVEAAAAWKGRPALVIQAGADQLMDASHARRLAEASGAPLWIVPGATHANCYLADSKGYVNHLVEFAESLSK